MRKTKANNVVFYSCTFINGNKSEINIAATSTLLTASLEISESSIWNFSLSYPARHFLQFLIIVIRW